MMKKTVAFILVALCLALSLPFSAFAAESVDLGDLSALSTGWWVISQEQVPGVYGVAFTAPSAFDGIELAMFCGGVDVPVEFTLYSYDGESIKTTVAGTPLCTVEQTVNGDHNEFSNNAIVCKFDKAYGTGRYVFAVRYNSDEFIEGGHMVVGSAGPCLDESLDVEYWYETFITNDATRDGFGGKLLLSDAPVEDPGEDKPALPYKTWDEYGAAVSLSWDTIFINAEGSMPEGFTDGHVKDYLEERDRTIDGSDSSISTIYARGWIGFDQDVVAMGYSVNGGAPVYVDNTLAAAEDAVKTAGGDHATRFTLPIDVSKLSGKNEIVVVAKLADGTEVAATHPTQPITFTYQGPEAKKPDVPPTSDATAAVFMIAAAAILVTVLLKKKAF